MKVYYALMVLVAAGSLQGCAHGRLEKQLDAKVAGETEVKSRTDLGQQAKARINGDSALTADQRSRLLALRESTAQQMDKLTNESLRLRSVLIQDLVASTYDQEEVDLIKKRIQNIEEKRVSAIFDAADQVNQILGRDTLRNQRMLNDFFEVPHGHYN